jgi:type I restriction enzyme S subunit
MGDPAMTRKTLDEYLKQATAHTTTKQPATKSKYRITGFYKETEFQETPIGKIPKQWKIVTLERIAEIVNGYTFPLELQGKKAGKYPFIKVGDMNNSYKYVTRAENYVDDDDLRKLRARVFPKGTIIFPKIGMAMKLNKFRILGCDALFDNNVAGLIPKNVNNEFLYYYLSGKVNLISLAGVTTVPSITKTRLRKLLIPLPPLEEQWGVAEVLSALDRAIEATERLIGRLERLKCGLMQELLTKGIGHKEFKDTPIGKIPKQWQVVRLGTLFTFKNGKRPSVVRERGQIPIYGAGFIQGYTDDFMVDEDNVIIIARVGKGSAGKVYIASGKMWISDNAIYATPKNNLAYPVFYYYLLQFLHLDKIAVRSAAGGYSLITQSSLNNLYVPLPPYEEQKYIASTLSSIDEWIKLEKKRKEKFERLKHGLMELLLTGRVRVRVARVGPANSSFG